MKVILCDNCGLNNTIDKYRIKLSDLILEKKLNLVDKEVVRVSQILDELLVECIACKKRTEEVTCLNLDEIWGIHSTFYYYGSQHLFVNLYQYIKQGIENNELVCVSMVDELYNNLLGTLKSEGIDDNVIKFCSVKELILSHKNGGVNNLKKKINSFINEASLKGYSGVRWIGQPTFAMQETSKEDFLNWEVDLSEAFENTKASLICIYDAYDYINNKYYIDEEVIKKSLDTHSHVLNKLVLKSIS